MSHPINLPPDLTSRPLWDIDDLTRVLPYSQSRIRSLVKEKKIPEPIKLFGKNMWNASTIMDMVRGAVASSEAKRAA